MRRIFAVLAVILGLSACANGSRQLEAKFEPLGDFKLGHSIVVAPNLAIGPLSRTATKEEWTSALDKEIEVRFRRYQGDKFYHLGISIEAYVLAAPGVPLVFSPKSALIARVTVWDDAAGTKLNEEPELFTVLESITPETVVGSGLTQSKEVQMVHLASNMSLQIEKWMRQKQIDEGWFGGPDAIGAEPLSAEELAAEVALADAEGTESGESNDEGAAPEDVTEVSADSSEDDTPADASSEPVSDQAIEVILPAATE